MKKNIFQFISLCLLIPFFACNEDSFSPVVEVTIPPHTSRLIIRADWTAGSDSLAVFVSKSRSVLDKSNSNFYSFDTIANAKVELLRNGQVLGTLPYYKAGYHYAKGLFKLDTTAGTVYTLRVSAPNLETVETSQTIQNAFVVLRGGYRKDGAVYSEQGNPFATPEKGDELNVEFQDNGAEENYYTLESASPNTFGGKIALVLRDSINKTFIAQAYLQDIDPNVEEGYLPDQAFNGKNYIWRFWFRSSLYFYSSTGGFNSIYGRVQKGDRIRFQVRSVNKDFVLFSKSLNLAQNAADNPFFSEPVILFSNVKNGYGIFTIGRVQVVDFVIP